MLDEWVETTLGRAAEVQMGQSPPGHSYNTAGIGLPFLQGSAEFGRHTPMPLKWCSQPSKVAEVGDLMVSVRAPVGDTNFADQRIAIGRGLAVVRAADGAMTAYLRLVLQQESAVLLSASGGGMFSSITAANLRALPIRLPPMRVQRRIVDVLACVDAHLANLGVELSRGLTVQQTLRQERWTRYSDDYLALGDVITGITAGRSPDTTGERPSPDRDGVLKVNAVDPSGRFLPLEAKALRDDHGMSPDWELHGGEVLVTRANTAERVAAVARVPNNIRRGLFLCDKTLRLDFSTDVLDADYLSEILLAPQAREQVAVMATGVGSSMVNLSQAKFRSWQVPIPTLADQRQSAILMVGARELVRTLDEERKALSTLRAVILSELLESRREIPDLYDHLLNEVA